MWMRSLFFVGRPKTGAETRLIDFVNRRFVPEARRLPGATAVLTFWSREQDDDLPPLWCQVAARFQTRDDMDAFVAGLRSPVLQGRLSRAMEDFEGTLSEVACEVGPVRQDGALESAAPAGFPINPSRARPLS